MISISIVTVIGLALAIIYNGMQWWAAVMAKRNKEIDDTDKEIDAASNANDFTRLFDRLRNK